MIKYQRASLFDAPRGSILVHACNCKGVWGSGIAKEFKARFPKSYEAYNEFCRVCESYVEFEPGQALLLPEENGYQVCCLFTSKDYGDKKDSPEQILEATESAIKDFLLRYKFNKPIYSNQFNSGLFGVPWEATADLLEELTGKFNWTVMVHEG